MVSGNSQRAFRRGGSRHFLRTALDEGREIIKMRSGDFRDSDGVNRVDIIEQVKYNKVEITFLLFEKILLLLQMRGKEENDKY